LAADYTAADYAAPFWSNTADVSVVEYGESQLELAWSGSRDDVGVTTYRIGIAGSSGVSSTSPRATITGLEPGTTYQFKVRASDKAGNWSEALTGTFRTARAYTDTPGTTFYEDELWMSGMDITRGCNPPANDRFCPDDPVTRAQMAAFVVRALGLAANTHGGFGDVPAGSTFAEDIGRLATAGITRGCNPPANDHFCPEDPITRGQLAAFLRRALGA
jgi:hypothetical protein